MEQQFRDTVSNLERELGSSHTAADIAERFVDGFGSDSSARFNDHSIALAGRVLTHMMHTCMRRNLDGSQKQSCFATRSAFVGHASAETELGALFKASSFNTCVPVNSSRLDRIGSLWRARELRGPA
jgi:hypothetical protein